MIMPKRSLAPQVGSSLSSALEGKSFTIVGPLRMDAYTSPALFMAVMTVSPLYGGDDGEPGGESGSQPPS
jgi:hypothetical protein